MGFPIIEPMGVLQRHRRLTAIRTGPRCHTVARGAETRYRASKRDRRGNASVGAGIGLVQRIGIGTVELIEIHRIRSLRAGRDMGDLAGQANRGITHAHTVVAIGDRALTERHRIAATGRGVCAQCDRVIAVGNGVVAHRGRRVGIGLSTCTDGDRASVTGAGIGAQCQRVITVRRGSISLRDGISAFCFGLNPTLQAAADYHAGTKFAVHKCIDSNLVGSNIAGIGRNTRGVGRNLLVCGIQLTTVDGVRTGRTQSAGRHVDDFAFLCAIAHAKHIGFSAVITARAQCDRVIAR